MANIITREVGTTAKGSPLTNAEIDNNFINLNTQANATDARTVNLTTSTLSDGFNTKKLSDLLVTKESAISAEYLHKGTTNINAMFVYDTSKDSDGGAWTEKCQHTSWYNETISAGKWLGPQRGLNGAVYDKPLTGNELVTNGSFDTGISGWTAENNASLSWINGKLRVTSVTGSSQTAYQTISVTAGKLYKFRAGSIRAYSNTGVSDVRGRIELSLSTGTFTTIYTTGLGNRLEASVDPQVTVFVPSANATLYIFAGTASNQSWAPAGYYTEVDDLSLKEITGISTSTSDYFLNELDNAFYRTRKNWLTYSSDLTPVTANWPRMSRYSNASAISLLGDITTSAGTLKFWNITDDTTNNQHGFQLGANGYDGGNQEAYAPNATFSFFLKRGVSNYVVVRQYSSTPYNEVKFNLDTLTYTSNAAGASIQSLGNNIYRISVTNSYIGGGYQRYHIWATDISGNSTYSGNGSVVFALGGLQLESGSNLSSYDHVPDDGQVFRGNKREFPKLSAIVSNTNRVNIYDLTEPGRPMWRSFYTVTGDYNSFLPSTVSAIAAINGDILLGMNNTTGNSGGITKLQMTADKAIRYYNGSRQQSYLEKIATANTRYFTPNLVPLQYIGTSVPINYISTFSGTDYEIDYTTGLRKYATAISGGGWWTLIKADGSTATQGFSSPLMTFLGNDDTFWQIGTRDGGAWGAKQYYGKNFSNVLAYSGYPSQGDTPGLNNVNWDWGSAYSSVGAGKFNAMVWNNPSNQVALFKASTPDTQKTLTAFINNSYNTGWLTSKIKRTYLSDTTSETIIGTELLLNGNFDSNIDNWTVHSWGGSPTISWDSSGKLAVTDNNTGAGAIVKQPITTIIGKRYLLTVNYASVSGFSIAGAIAQNADNAAYHSYVARSNSSSLVFTAAATTTYVGAYLDNNNPPRSALIESISCRLVESDRSYKGAVIPIYGTLTKTPAATGSQLVAYSGFSA